MNKIYCYALLLVVSLFAANANGAPMAYSVNSDSGNESAEDSLYVIDLSSGVDTLRGKLFTGIENRIDTEGLAFSSDGTLWGIDDNSLTLFPISTANGAINPLNEIPLSGVPIGGGNDFGMSFSCDSSMYITSVVARSLYRLDMEGNSEIVGSIGALGANISAIAAIGQPTRLYGLGNGQFENGDADSPNLYSINTDTGVATLIGPLGAAVGAYNQGGLAFDSSGGLWAITDRRIVNGEISNLASQILSINVDSGAATVMSGTGEVGFESLAIGPPANCGDVSSSGQGDGLERIPTLSLEGRLLAIFVLLVAGFGILRKHTS
ncbi:MAG: hypothetical protein GQ538_13110 [Xanthomonadales bacterium]|nr:hypothetical protein [Xanthomonadales bacterium]